MLLIWLLSSTALVASDVKLLAVLISMLVWVVGRVDGAALKMPLFLGQGL
jgi:hypothetical protein